MPTSLTTHRWRGRCNVDASAFRIRQMQSLGFGVLAIDEVSDAKGLIVEGTFISIPDVIGTMKRGWQQQYRDALRELYGLGA